MIKKTFDNYSLSQNEKDALFERISNTVAKNSSKKAKEKQNNKISFMKYATAAASVILITGITALVLHLATPGQPIEISTPQNSNSGMVNSTDNSGTRPEDIDVLGLPFYKDSSVINMTPQPSGYEGSETVRFAEVRSDNGEYTYIVAGDFIRREENRYEARLNLYLYKDSQMLGKPGKFDIGAGTLYYSITKEDMEQFESRLLKVYSVSQNDKVYPLIALSHRVNKSVMEDLFYSDEYEYGTILFSVKDDRLFRFNMNGDFETCYPEFDVESVSGNKTTDKKGWVTEFDFENESAYADAAFYDEAEQEILDSLLPFEDSSIPVYDGFMGNNDIPYAKVLIDTKTCGEYTFTLYASMVKRTDSPDRYFGHYSLIVSRNGRALSDSFIAAAHDTSQYAMRIPRDYNYSNMLKVYTMTQNGKAYPLASVTYNIPDEMIANGFGANSLTRFFTVRNGVGDFFSDSFIDYKDLPSEVQVTDLSIGDSVNGKKIIFDFEKRRATVINLGDGEINIKQRPYYKNSRIYNEAIFDDFDM
ncbi:MAG: hypothetical protein IKT78_01890, partial [Ruminiclostridium sp.]|nr:hypothetical protein [Ruminiclostridium sp.]